MKNIIKSITIFCVSIGLASCLEQVPYSQIVEDDFYKNTQEVEAALIGCYNAMHATLKNEWTLTELRADLTRMSQNSTSTAANLLLVQLDQGTISSNNPRVQEYWDASYHAIHRCNVVLQPSVNKNVSDSLLRKQFIGEALFIRSLQLFNLVRLYGPIFMPTTPITADDAKLMARESVVEVYEQIEKDLIVAMDSLPKQYDTENLGRATHNAAKALLAKVYLTQWKFAKAEPLLSEIIDELGTNLISYPSVFDKNNEMNDEIIFAVRYKSGNIGLGSPFGNYFAPLNSGDNVINGDGKGFNYPTTYTTTMYEAGDARKNVSMKESYYNASTKRTVLHESQGGYICKFLNQVMLLDDGESDFPIIRYADVLLMYAEVLNELGTGNPLTYINYVRTRAELPNLESLTSKLQIRDAIEKERMVEFAFENHRWFDLLRWGKAKDVINNHLKTEKFYALYEYSVENIEDWQLLLPIPLSIMNINDQISQNPGY